jgi:single-strand DNA-binding protein
MNSTHVTIAGNLADAPQVRFTPSGKATARLRVAVNERYQNGSGEWVEAGTSWHTVIAWGQLAENAAASIAKGDRVIVHGRLAERAYTADTEEKRTVWEVAADEIGISLRSPTAQPPKTNQQTRIPTAAGSPF